ncbi:MAG: hypothetical protein K0S61_4093 [Anaerocolumna sp.]|nr:hypothetical protein [Anaerocolumna sp.]
MKRVTSVCIIGGGNKIRSELYEQFKEKIPKEFSGYKYTGGQLNLPLNSDSDELHQVIEIAQKNNLHPTLFSKVYYTKKEIEEYNFFQMRILSPLEIEGTDASDYGTKYEGGCPNPSCRLGKKLIGDVLVDRKFMKWDIGSLRPDIYVTKKLKEVIFSNKCTGVLFEKMVKDFKNREMPEFFVMEINNVLAPMSSSTWLVSDSKGIGTTKECNHQIIYLRSDLHYEREKLEGALDFNMSVEYVDNFREQEIIVSNKVRKLFIQHKIHAAFFPITVI